MVQDTLLTLIQTAKSVFHPSSAESLKNFEKYVYENRVDIFTQPDGNVQVRYQKRATDDIEMTDFNLFSDELFKMSSDKAEEDSDDDDTTSYSSIE